jgi:Fe-S-cluster containining protein
VWLEDGETASLARALGMNEATFVATCVRDAVDPRTGRRGRALVETVSADARSSDAGGRCILLEGANTCRAYASRPAQCLAFPYWPSVLADRAAFESARSTCPGIAVEPPREVRERAFERLAQLYRDVEECTSLVRASGDESCCLDATSSDELFATGLEADYAAEHAQSRDQDASANCRLGEARPLACRCTRTAPFAPTIVDERASASHRSGSRCASVDANAPPRDTNAPPRDTNISDALRARFFERLRAIERETGYPAAYARMSDHLRARTIHSRPEGSA